MLRKWYLLLCLSLLGAVQSPVYAQKSSSTFAFVHITDIHQTANGSTDPFTALANATTTMPIRPSFVIATGDITEAGKAEEYERVKKTLPNFTSQNIGFYAVPGNHDTRWTPNGKQVFEKFFGKTYQSFDYEGTHFILLDSTVRLSHWGHFDSDELEWLGRDLKRVHADTPIFLFMHHWMGRDTADTRPIDNEYDFWPLFRGKNLLGIFTGHGHQDLTWKTHGITTVMAKGLYQGSYHRVTVSPVMVTIERISKENSKGEVVARIPVKGNSARSQLRVGWNDPNLPYLVRRRPTALLEPRAFQDTTEGEIAEYRVDGGEWAPLKRDSRDIWSETFLTKSLTVGIHTAGVRLTTSNHEPLEDELIFEVEREINEPNRRWAVDLKDAIQSDPLVSEEFVYVTCLDRYVYALLKSNGKTKWSYKTDGEIVGSPVLQGGTLYVASSDGNLYALEADNGRFLWKYDTGQPIVATPSVSGGVVSVGGTNKIVGVHTDSGQLAWTVPTSGFFQSRAVTDGTNFYLGGWDNTLYAISAKSGEVVWRVTLGFSASGQSSFYYAPAISSPALESGRVYICSNDGYLHALSTQNGGEVWKVRAPKGGGAFGYSSPSVVAGTIYLASLGEEGVVYALDSKDGSVKWQSKTNQNIYDSSVKVAPDGNSLVIIGVRGRVSVLDTHSGKRLWGYELGPGNVLSTPDYDGKVVYTTTMARDVQALNAPGVGDPILRKK